MTKGRSRNFFADQGQSPEWFGEKYNPNLDINVDNCDILPYHIVSVNGKYHESGELKTLSDQLKSSFDINCQGLDIVRFIGPIHIFLIYLLIISWLAEIGKAPKLRDEG